MYQFNPVKLRPLPVLVMADTSGSMKGEKIEALNHALRTMAAELAKLDDVRGEVYLGVITFGGEPEILQPLVPVREANIPELSARGRTPLGSALSIAQALLEDREVIPARAFFPTLVLISDGQPTDLPEGLTSRMGRVGSAGGAEELRDAYLGWEPIRNLHASYRAARAQRLALGIGAGGPGDPTYALLEAFINQPGVPVARANEAGAILRFLQWVTLSVASRTRGRDPNAITPELLDLSHLTDTGLVL